MMNVVRECESFKFFVGGLMAWKKRMMCQLWLLQKGMCLVLECEEKKEEEED